MDLRFIGLGSLVEAGKAAGADMAVEAGLIQTSTVQVKAGVAERADVANAVVACLRGPARQACKVKRRCQDVFGSIPLKDLISKAPVTSYSGASTASSGKTPRASVVGHSVMEFITRLKQMKILEPRDQPLMKEDPDYTSINLKAVVGPAQRVSKRKCSDGSMQGDSSVQQGKKRKAVTEPKPRMSQPRGSRKNSQVKDTIIDNGYYCPATP
ncbi:hypothetical protein KI688_011276 [Linnemannia hyalina]|uniref:Uncharacterized protein n=1 Tax=Linnemannia hyalina TaxID=64524 RepID=A0A9P8BSZ5_9FUNG|nr:hypothetical protein KI688_011276 [Linnemannia hyalina]